MIKNKEISISLKQFCKDGFEEEVMSSLKDVNLLHVMLGEAGRGLSKMSPYIQNGL